MNSFTPVRGIMILILTIVSTYIISPILSVMVLHCIPGVSPYIRLHIPYLVMFLTLCIGTKLIAKSSLSVMFAESNGIFRSRFAIEVAIVYFIMMVLFSLLKGDLKPNPPPMRRYIISFIPILIMTPLQCIAEEMIFRVLPARIIYKDRLPDRLLASLPLIIITGILFTLPHIGNREVRESSQMLLPILCYFLWGGLAAFISVATDGFEAAAAMHIANNLYIALIVNYEGSSMPTQSIFKAKPAGSMDTLIETVVVFAVIYLFALKRGECKNGFMPTRRN